MNNKVLFKIIDAVAGRLGDKIAVVEGDSEYTYSMLLQSTDYISRVLLELGLKKGQAVCVFMENSFVYVTSIISINKAGGVFLPVEVSNPDERVAEILSDAGVEFIVASAQQVARVASIVNTYNLSNATIVSIQEAGGLIYAQMHAPGQGVCSIDGAAPLLNLSSVEGDDSCYLMCTSGSTGKPKIIEGVHKGLSHFIHWEKEEFQIDEHIVVSQLTPIGFDVSLRDIFLPLTCGGTLCIPKSDVLSQPASLVEWLIDRKIQLVHCVPSLLRIICLEVAHHPSRNLAFDQLRLIFFAGEPLYGKDVRICRDVMGHHIQLVNLYGPSETTLAKMFHRIDLEYSDADVVPLGQPISSTKVIILNDQNKLCRVGERGEICIKTPFRSKGYYKDEKLSAEKFIQNPLHNDFTDIIYRTGDIGEYAHDHTIVFRGRLDNQVKVQGNRVELYEIESRIRKFSGVEQTVVVAVRRNDETELICYFTGAKADSGQLKMYLSQSVPRYMVPAYFIQLDKFELGKNGKIDRRMLPPINNDKAAVRVSEDQLPHNELEVSVSKIWKEIFQDNSIGRTDSFLEVGGSSIKALKIISRIYKDLGILLKLPDIFNHPSIAELAGFIKQSALPQDEIIPVPSTGPIGLSPAQHRLWMLARMEEDNGSYNIFRVSKVCGELNVDSLQNACEKMIARHESLRTIFHETDYQPYQQILDPAAVSFCIQRIRGEQMNDGEVTGVVHKLLHTPFDFSIAPLFRLAIITVAPSEHIFVFVIHHIIADGWSCEIFLNELMLFYRSITIGDAHNPAPFRIQYKDYSSWHNRFLTGEEGSKSKDFWSSDLQDLATLNLASDFDRPAIKTSNGLTFRLHLPVPLAEKLRRFGKQFDTTVFTALLSSFRSYIRVIAGEDDAVIGTVTAGREHTDCESQIGNFVKTLPLRLRISPEDTFFTLVERERLHNQEVFKNQYFPFEEMVKLARQRKDPSRFPLFDVGLVFHAGDMVTNPIDGAGLTFEPFEVVKTTSRFDLLLSFHDENPGILLLVEFNTDIYLEATVRRLIDGYLVHIEDLLDSPDKLLYQFNVLSATAQLSIDLSRL